MCDYLGMCDYSGCDYLETLQFLIIMDTWDSRYDRSLSLASINRAISSSVTVTIPSGLYSGSEFLLS